MDIMDVINSEVNKTINQLIDIFGEYSEESDNINCKVVIRLLESVKR